MVASSDHCHFDKHWGAKIISLPWPGVKRFINNLFFVGLFYRLILDYNKPMTTTNPETLNDTELGNDFFACVGVPCEQQRAPMDEETLARDAIMRRHFAESYGNI